MMIWNIFAYGDSITYGASDKEHGGWASQLRLYFDKKSNPAEDAKYYCYNLGISGETTDGLLARFKSETQVRLEKAEENIIIFAYGANDAAYLPQEKRFNVEIDKFRSNMEKMIEEAKVFSQKLLLLNITPVVDSLAKDKEFRSRTNERVDQYNEVLMKFVDEKTVFLADVHSAFVKAGFEKLMPIDGLHPNAEGHKILFETVKIKLEKMLEA